MNIRPLTPKQYHALSFDVTKLPNLRQAGWVSSSVLSSARDPLRMVWCPRQQTNDMQWGSLIDCLWTTPGQFDSDYAILPEDAPRDVRKDSRIANAKKPSDDSLRAIDWWNNFDKIAQGRTVLKPSELQEAKSAISMLNQHDLARFIHQDSTMQVAIAGESPWADCNVKCLIDLLPQCGPFVDAIVDLKTTHKMDEGALFSTSRKFDYAFKLALYGCMAEAAGCGPRPRGVIIWQNSSFPYEVKVREIPQAKMEAARAEIRKRFDILQTINPADMRAHFDTELREMVWPDWDYADTEEE